MSGKRAAAPDRLTETTGHELLRAAEAQDPGRDDTLVLDFSGCSFMDSRGGAWVGRVAEIARSAGADVRIEGQQGQVADFLEMIGPGLTTATTPKPKPMGLIERIGDTTVQMVKEAGQIADLVFDTLYWLIIAPFEGRGFRWDSFTTEMYEMGVRAIRINCLMNFLLGLTIAMMSAAQLRSFGLDVYVADLVVIAFARELAVIMTGVVVAARTGAAITAELANMKVQEEIDALNGMGLNVSQYLVAPKLLSLVVAMPCLTALGMVMGVLGGAFWGTMVLDHRMEVWMDHTLASATIDDVMQGLIKSFFFANVIVFVGCHNGLRVTGGSRGVGLMTTRAVVMDIFAMVVIDMAFAALLYYVLE